MLYKEKNKYVESLFVIVRLNKKNNKRPMKQLSTYIQAMVLTNGINYKITIPHPYYPGVYQDEAKKESSTNR